jgi:hypothetical protein
VIVRVRSQKLEQGGKWGRKENGIVGRVTLSVAEVCNLSQHWHKAILMFRHYSVSNVI